MDSAWYLIGVQHVLALVGKGQAPCWSVHPRSRRGSHRDSFSSCHCCPPLADKWGSTDLVTGVASPTALSWELRFWKAFLWPSLHPAKGLFGILNLRQYRFSTRVESHQDQVSKKSQSVVYPHLSLMFPQHIQHAPQRKVLVTFFVLEKLAPLTLTTSTSFRCVRIK